MSVSITPSSSLFVTLSRMLMEFLSPYSPFCNPIVEFFSALRWKVYDHQPYTQMNFLAAMDEACDDITAHACRGWTRNSGFTGEQQHHKRRYSLWCGCECDWNVRCRETEVLAYLGVERQHCNPYSTACIVFPEKIVPCSHFYFCFFPPLCNTMLSFPFCFELTWSVNKLQYKQ